MDTPISWIKEYVPDLPVNIVGQNGTTKDETDKKHDSNVAMLRDFVDRITLSGSHVESSVLRNDNLRNLYIGKIVESIAHPTKNRCLICQIDIGRDKPVQIGAGTDNVQVGDYVLALVSDECEAMVPFDMDHKTLKQIPVNGGKKIKPQPFGKDEDGNDIMSYGMLCALIEVVEDSQVKNFPLDDPEDEDGIYVIPKDWVEKQGMKPGDDAAELLGLTDASVEYEITSNRVDCFSIIGMAREAAATFGCDFVMPDNSVKGTGGDVNDYASVEVLDSDLCPRYCARVVTDVRIAPSPMWLQDRLRSRGIRPINNIVDITNYVMEEYGQPMHAFDLDDIAGHKIVVKRAEDGEKFGIIDNEEESEEEKAVVLDRDVLMICDGERSIGIAGIKGGENSKIKDGSDSERATTSILFEAACFDGTNIRLSSRRLNLATDSAAKFVKGLDPNLAIEAINRACHLIEELDCGKVVDGVIDVYPNPVQEKVLPFEPDKMNGLLGLQVSEDEMLDIFRRLELRYNEADKTLTIPTFRQDLGCMADLAEEVARFYGYDRIPATLPTVNAGIGGVSHREEINRLVRAVSEENGFSQCYCYSFESPKVFDKLLLPEDHPAREAIRISNPLGEDFSIMRTLPLNGLLSSLSTNYNRRNKNVRLYELGKVYLPKALPLTELPDEKERLVLGMYGDCDFFTLKGVVEEILGKLNFGKDCQYKPTQEITYLHPGRQAIITKGNLRVGYVGQLHPEAALNYGCKGEIYIAEIDMEVAAMLSRFNIKYSGIAKFPASTRDLALVCDRSKYVGDIERVIRKNAGKILESLEIFDVYEGEQVGEGKKSVAYSLTFRSKDHTLKDDEINPAIDKVLTALSKEGIEIRG